jgi:hypothetical protein
MVRNVWSYRATFTRCLAAVLLPMAFFVVSAPAGAASTRFGAKGEGAGMFQTPKGIAAFFAGFTPVAATSRFGAKGGGAGLFRKPDGIAVDEETGDAYLVDGQNSRTERWTRGGEFVSAWGWGVRNPLVEAFQICSTTCFAGLTGPGSGEFGERPEGIAVDNALGSPHDVYVVDPRNKRVQKFSPSGEFLLMFGGEVNAATHGNVCVAGEECQAGTAGTSPGQFAALGGEGIAVDSSGDVYVGDENRIDVFSPGGAFIKDIALPGAGLVVSLAVDSTGDLYVVASELAGVHKLDGSGTELGAPRDAEGGHGRSIAVGPSDELFVYDGEKSHLFEFNAAGALQRSISEPGGDGGIAVDADEGDILVAHETFVQRLETSAQGPSAVSGSESAMEVSPTGATFTAAINPEGVPAEYHFEYGTTAAYGESTAVAGPLAAVNEVQSVSVTASGGTFTLAFNNETTGELPFNATPAEVEAALGALPALGTGQVAVSGPTGGTWSVEFVGAQAGGDVAELSASAGGLTGPEPSAVVTTTTPGHSLFEDRPVSAAVTGLSPATTYHFRVVASNGAQTTVGPDETFSTLPATSIDGIGAADVTTTSAQLVAQLNPHGQRAEYSFEYGTDTSYGRTAPARPGVTSSIEGDETVKVPVTGLEPGVRYHFRVVTHNVFGETVSEDRSFTTDTTAVHALLDGRQLQQVSPQNKHGVSLEALSQEGGIIQSSTDGTAIAYFAKGPITEDPAGNRSISDQQLLGTRTPNAWNTTDITTPYEEIIGLTVGKLSEYEAFSTDLGVGLVAPFGATPLSELATERTPYIRTAAGSFVPLVYPGDVPPGTKFGGAPGAEPGTFVRSILPREMTANGEHVILSSPSGLTPGIASTNAENLYEWTAGHLEVVSVMPTGVSAAEEEVVPRLGNNDLQMRNAVSQDGDRVFFVANNHLYLRDVGRHETIQIDTPDPGARGGPQSPSFQIASVNGDRVYFTDGEALTVGASGGGDSEPDLYRCDVELVAGKLRCALSDITLAMHGGEPGAVRAGVIGADDEGNTVYFVANGQLTPGAVQGNCVESVKEPPETQCNLYVYNAEAKTVALVAVLSNIDAPDWAGGDTGDLGRNLGDMTSRVSGDGRYLAFMSREPLTEYDNRDATTAVRDEEVFEYDHATNKLTCVSCSSTGARPHGVFDEEAFPGLLVDRPRNWENRTLAGSIPGWTAIDLEHASRQPRYLSNSGRLFFNSPVNLVPADGNGKEDVYEYEPMGRGSCETANGCIALLSGGTSGEESAFGDASESGDDAFLISAAALAPTDTDQTLDMYDAHVCSAAAPCFGPAPAPAQPCDSVDSCRPAALPQPAFGEPPTSATIDSGNLTSSHSESGVHDKKRLTRAQLLKRALRACQRTPKRKRRSCVASAKRRYGPPNTHQSRRAARHGRSR